MVNHLEWINDYKLYWQQHGQAKNDAESYGVVIHKADIAGAPRGTIYWRIVGIHHLTPAENVGKNNVFVDTVDEAWQPIRQTFVKWTWEGMQDHESADPVRLDKPLNEPGSNITLTGVGMIVHMRCTGILDPDQITNEDQGGLSDWASNLHTGHGDEEIPGTGQNGSYTGHHSFYVCWQRTVLGDIGSPDPEPPPMPPPAPPDPLPAPVASVGKLYVRISQSDIIYFRGQSGAKCDNRPRVHHDAPVLGARPDGRSVMELIIDMGKLKQLEEDHPTGIQFRSLFVELFRDDPE